MGRYLQTDVKVLLAAVGSQKASDPFNVAGLTYVCFQLVVSGGASLTVTFEATADGTNWVSLLVTPTTSATAVTTATASGVFTAHVAGLLQVRLNVSAWSSGTVTGTVNGTTAP